LRQGGDQPTYFIIDNVIASTRDRCTTPFGITETTVRFAPN